MLGPMAEEKPAHVIDEEKPIYVREWVEFLRRMQGEGDNDDDEEEGDEIKHIHHYF